MHCSEYICRFDNTYVVSTIHMSFRQYICRFDNTYVVSTIHMSFRQYICRIDNTCCFDNLLFQQYVVSII
jgi:hypothetical protein